MRILGIGTGGDSGAALVEDGRILAAVNEERISRMKLVEGFPRGSIRDVLAQTSSGPRDLDRVMVAATSDLLKDELEAFEGWFQHHPRGAMGAIKRMAGKLSPLRARIPLLERGYYALLEPGFAARRRRVEQILREEFERPLPDPVRGSPPVPCHFCVFHERLRGRSGDVGGRRRRRALVAGLRRARRALGEAPRRLLL